MENEPLPFPTDLTSPKVAARLVHCHISSVYRWIVQGRLKAFKRAGTRHLVSRAAVLALIEEERPPQMPPKRGA